MAKIETIAREMAETERKDEFQKLIRRLQLTDINPAYLQNPMAHADWWREFLPKRVKDKTILQRLMDLLRGNHFA